MKDDLHNKHQWTVGDVLKRQSETMGNKNLLQVEGGSLSYAQAYQRGCQVANLLRAHGVECDDFVAAMLPNSMEFCLSWFGLSLHGAVHVAINSDYKGSFLSHVLNNSRARFLIIDAEYLDRIEAIHDELHYLQTIFVVGQYDGNSSFDTLRFSSWQDQPDTAPAYVPSYRDNACVMYTSGTTGPSKGVLMPHAHLYLFALGTIKHMQLTADDVFYIVLPLFHANGLFMQLYASMVIGARAVIRRKFSASQWIHDVVKHGATATNSLGVVGAFVLNQPETDLDRQHKLRVMSMAPLSAEVERGLKQRFGIREVLGLYGMTEINIPLYVPLGESHPDSCGQLWDEYYELRIVDPDTDEVLPTGDVGEIVVRPKTPYGFMSGYLNMPDKTVEAWRNFWFHTGDAARADAIGNIYFVDRIKDCIRRRGENISSFELENTFAGFPGVQEVAAYAVNSDIEGAEDEVMVALVHEDPAQLHFEQLDRFAKEKLPKFAVPRYYRLLDKLPKTPTGKIQKHLLRKEGSDLAAWDGAAVTPGVRRD